MKTITKDARGFVEGVMGYLRQEGKTLSAVPKVQVLLNKVTAQAKTASQAKVVSAVVLTVREEERVSRLIAENVGHPVTLETQVNREVLGGLKVQVGDWVIDGTLLGQLKQMSDTLI